MFSRTVGEGMRLKNCKIKPMWWSLRLDRSSSLSPLRAICMMFFKIFSLGCWIAFHRVRCFPASHAFCFDSQVVVGVGSPDFEVSEAAAGAFLGDDQCVPSMGYMGAYGWFNMVFVVYSARWWFVMRILGLWSVCVVSGGHLQGNSGSYENEDAFLLE